MARKPKPLSYEALDLLGQIADGNGGALAVDYIVEMHGRRPMNTLSARGFINFVNYANGEHACMTDAGHDYIEANP